MFTVAGVSLVLLFKSIGRCGGKNHQPDVTFRYHPEVAFLGCRYKVDVVAFLCRYKFDVAVVLCRYKSDVAVVLCRYKPDVAVVVCRCKSNVAVRYKPNAAVVVHRYQPGVSGEPVLHAVGVGAAAVGGADQAADGARGRAAQDPHQGPQPNRRHVCQPVSQVSQKKSRKREF